MAPLATRKSAAARLFRLLPSFSEIGSMVMDRRRVAGCTCGVDLVRVFPWLPRGLALGPDSVDQTIEKRREWLQRWLSRLDDSAHECGAAFRLGLRAWPLRARIC